VGHVVRDYVAEVAGVEPAVTEKCGGGGSVVVVIALRCVQKEVAYIVFRLYGFF
jgi:hypothetical protein